MIQRKHVLIVSTLIIGTLLTSFVILEVFTLDDSPSTAAVFTPSEIHPNVVNESHLIQNIPYVSQETIFFCHYASLTMIFQYYGIETDLSEVLYYSGIGYSLLYPDTPSLCPIMGSYLVSQQPDDNSFIASLYGLSFDMWRPDDSMFSEDKCWNEYWIRVKQNISNNIPIETSVDPLSMPSIRQQFDVPESTWDYFISIGHAIVIIGYNESNQTVCYNDPIAAVIGDAHYGTYAWMSIDEFKEAVSKRSVYLIHRFEKTFNPLPPDEAFEIAHERNIIRLQGDRFAYDESFQTLKKVSLGIEASKELRDDFQRGLKHRLKTIFCYKYTGRLLKKINRRNLFIKIWLQLPSSFMEFVTPSENEFNIIAIEKRYAANYLRNSEYAAIWDHEACLFEQEAEYWSQLSLKYDVFLKRGFFLCLPRAIYIMKNMESSIDDILSLEEVIIERDS